MMTHAGVIGTSHPTWAAMDDQTTVVLPPVADNTETVPIPARRDEAAELANTSMTIDTMAFFAWVVAGLCMVVAVLYSLRTGYIVTDSNIWLTATAALMSCTGAMGRRDASNLAQARRVRNVMCLGLVMGLCVFAGAIGLTILQMIIWSLIS